MSAAAIEANFARAGSGSRFPKPDVSNTTYKRWRREGRELFYRPATAQMTYATWMSAHGQGKHWTVANEADRAKVGWEDAAQGYWFTAEVAGRLPPAQHELERPHGRGEAPLPGGVCHRVPDAPRPHGRASRHQHLVLGCARATACALRAGAFAGEVLVGRIAAGDLSVPLGSVGGRAVEVIKNAT